MANLSIDDILPAPQPPRVFRIGVIRIYYTRLDQFGIDMKGCTTQGEFADKGIFAELHQKLLLPASYTIRGVFIRWPYRDWEIVIESPDLPVIEQGAEPPDITPVYQKEEDGTVHLITIKIEERWQRERL